MQASDLKPGQCDSYTSEALKRMDEASRLSYETIERETCREAERNGRKTATVADVENALNRIVVTVTGWDDEPQPTVEPLQLREGGCQLIANERARQIEQEGWTPEHDNEHKHGELIRAAILYAGHSYSWWEWNKYTSTLWPWHDDWWKPEIKDRIRNLEKAGGLIAAEIDRLIRTKAIAEVTPTPEPDQFKAGDLVVCVDAGGISRLVLGNLYQVSAIDDAYGFLNVEGGTFCTLNIRRFRRATAAEIAAYTQPKDTRPLEPDEVPQVGDWAHSMHNGSEWMQLEAVLDRSQHEGWLYRTSRPIAQEPQPDAETPIELQRFGPPPFKRPTLDDLEDVLIESIDSMSKEEIEAELREAGIDMAPALEKLHAMIEAKKAEQAQPDADGWIEWHRNRCPTERSQLVQVIWREDGSESKQHYLAGEVDWGAITHYRLVNWDCEDAFQEWHMRPEIGYDINLVGHERYCCAMDGFKGGWKARESEAVAANQQVLVLAAANEKLTEQNHNLCLLVVRLARRVRFFEKGSDVATKALDYLSRNGLMPSVLRGEKK